MEWKEILTFFINYGVLGIIGYFSINKAVTSFPKIMDTLGKMLKLMEKIVSQSEDIKNKIDKIEKLEDDNKIKLIEMDNRFQLSMVQVVESIYDEKMLGNDVFNMLADSLNLKYTYKAVVIIMKEIDENGLDDIKRLTLLKDNIITTLKRSYTDMKKDIMGIAYSHSKLNEFEHSLGIVLASFVSEIEDLLSPISYEDLRDDRYYVIFKENLRNKMWEFSANLTGMIKNISKKY